MEQKSFFYIDERLPNQVFEKIIFSAKPEEDFNLFLNALRKAGRIVHETDEKGVKK